MATKTDTGGTRPSIAQLSGVSLPLILAVTASLIGAVVRLYGLRIQGLWSDELFTAMYAVHYLPGENFLRLLMQEPHPPLYYIFMRLLMDIVPINEVTMRLPSAICSAAAPPALYWLTRREIGRPAACAACMLLACSSFCVFYAQEARFYGPLQLYGAVSAGLWLQLIAHREAPPVTTLYWLTLTNFVGSLEQTFGFITAGFECALLFLLVPVIRTNIRFYLCAAVSLLPYVVWVVVSFPYFSHMVGVGAGYWISTLTVGGLISPGRSLFAQPSTLLIFLLPLAVNGWSAWRRIPDAWHDERRYLFLGSVAVSVAVVVFSAVVSVAVTFIYFDKNFLAIFPFIYIALGMLLVNTAGVGVNRMLAGLFAILFISLATFLVSGYPLRAATPFYRPYKEQVREAVHFVWQHAGPNDIVVLPVDDIRALPVRDFRIYTLYWNDPARMRQVIMISQVPATQVSQLTAIAARAQAEHRNLFLYDDVERHFDLAAVDAALRAGGCGVAHSWRAAWVLAISPGRPCTSADLPAAGAIWPP